jgi:phage baseplate assembly protein W
MDLDLASDFRVVSGRRALIESLARRLDTPRGRLIDDPNYGTSLPGEVNDDLSQADIARIQAATTAECLKDERVVDATSDATFVNGVLTLNLEITDGQGPFPLTLAVSAVTVEILQVNP